MSKITKDQALEAIYALRSQLDAITEQIQSGDESFTELRIAFEQLGTVRDYVLRDLINGEDQ